MPTLIPSGRLSPAASSISTVASGGSGGGRDALLGSGSGAGATGSTGAGSDAGVVSGGEVVVVGWARAAVGRERTARNAVVAAVRMSLDRRIRGPGGQKIGQGRR